MATISTEVLMTFERMSPLVAAASRMTFNDVEDDVLDVAASRTSRTNRFPTSPISNRHARRAAAARARKG